MGPGATAQNLPTPAVPQSFGVQKFEFRYLAGGTGKQHKLLLWPKDLECKVMFFLFVVWGADLASSVHRDLCK